MDEKTNDVQERNELDDKADDVQERNELDHFTRFMFGEKRNLMRGERKSSDINNDFIENQPEMEDFEEKRAREREWLFGVNTRHSPRHQGQDKTTITDLLNQIDYTELMHHVDTFMSSTKQLKPLIKKLRPYVEMLLNKKEGP